MFEDFCGATAQAVVISSHGSLSGLGLGAKDTRRLNDMPDPTPLYQDATAVLTCRELDALPDARPGIVVCQISHASNLDFLLPAPQLHSPSALPRRHG